MKGMAEGVPRRAAVSFATAVAEHGWAVREHQRILAEQHQARIDSELRATRRALVGAARRRGAAQELGFLDEDFLAVADRPALFEAIIDAAVTTGGAACADLQLFDSDAGVLRIVAQWGLSSRFLDFFVTVDSGGSSACAVALSTRNSVSIEEVSRSPLFTPAGRDVMLDAGSSAVYSYPLMTATGDVLGVLSLHRPTPADRSGNAAFVAHCAAQALVRTS